MQHIVYSQHAPAWMIEVDIDADGKRGYLQSTAMAGVYMILAGCQVLGREGAINSNTRFTRENKE